MKRLSYRLRFLTFVASAIAVLCSAASAQGPDVTLASQPSSTPPSTPPAAPSEEFFEAARLVAYVGEEPVIAGQVAQLVETELHKLKAKGLPAHQVDQARRALEHQALVVTINNKMIAQQYMREIVGNKPPAERRKIRQEIQGKLLSHFYEDIVPSLIKSEGLVDEQALDEKLRKEGSSIAALQSSFIDSAIMGQAMQEIVPKDPYVDILDIRAAYEGEIEQWQRPTRLRYQQMSVLYSRIRDPNAAAAEIRSMYDEVHLGGASFDAVARRRSHDWAAQDGGHHDWITQGALKSKAIETTLFSIPTGKLSEIIQDEDGLHFVLVVEREDAHVVSFAQAQQEIRKRLQAQEQERARKKYLDDLRANTAVWSIYPEDFPGARPLGDLFPNQATPPE